MKVVGLAKRPWMLFPLVWCGLLYCASGADFEALPEKEIEYIPGEDIRPAAIVANDMLFWYREFPAAAALTPGRFSVTTASGRHEI